MFHLILFCSSQKLSLKVLLSFCLLFCQFQRGVAYKSVACKQVYSDCRLMNSVAEFLYGKSSLSFFPRLLLTTTFKSFKSIFSTHFFPTFHLRFRSCFFLVYQIAILECNELDTNYFFDCFAGFQGMVFFLKRNN